MHHRLSPKENRFDYNIFMFYLDLDEIDNIHSTLKFFSRNRFNLFSFIDKPRALAAASESKGSTKEKIISYLRAHNINGAPGRIMLLTNVAVLGYSFNPISIYICYNQYDKPFCAIAEVSNTHGEMKLYLLDQTTLDNNTFRLRTRKHFYVSPFSDLDVEFDFILHVPDLQLNMRVDDYEQGKRFLLSRLTGTQKALTDSRLALYALTFPMITIKIIMLIHWQALILWLKGLRFRSKSENPVLQKNLVRYKA
jgi:DUF1365 family protein